MKYRIDRSKSEPAYIQLYELIRDDIVGGAYRFGARLPSKRILAEDARVSVITVAHAYELLEDEGYAKAREKSGYFVIYREDEFLGESRTLPAAVRRSESAAEAVSRPYVHGAGELSYHIIARTMRRVLLDCGEKILEPSPGKGLLCLREELSMYLARTMGIKAGPEQIVVGAGAEYLYGMVTQLLDECASVAVEKPCYEKIKKVYEREGLKVEELELGSTGIRSEQLRCCGAQILHVTPFHSYPSNVSADISKKNEYIRWARGGRYIIEDNYDSELTVSKKMEKAVYSLAEEENVIFINTFSRTIAPSLRVGYMVLPQRLAAGFDRKLGFYSCSVPTFEQFVLCELLRSGEFERHINRVRRKLRG